MSKPKPAEPFSYDSFGENGRRELEHARHDPRLARGRAAVADYWDAMEEVELARKQAVLGAHALRDLAAQAGSGVGRAQWARADMASSAITNDFPALNAQTLVAMNSALDSMVEEFAPTMRDILLKATVEQAIKKAEEQAPDAAAQLDDTQRQLLSEVFNKTVTDMLPKLERLLGSGAERYEARLRGVHLGTARPIPPDLDEALKELGAIRDVLTHRASRIDTKALEQAPTLAQRYSNGDLVRLTGQDYRRYSAAIRCYGQDVTMRPMRGWPNFTEEDLPDLASWRNYYVLGA